MRVLFMILLVTELRSGLLATQQRRRCAPSFILVDTFRETGWDREEIVFLAVKEKIDFCQLTRASGFKLGDKLLEGDYVSTSMFYR